MIILKDGTPKASPVHHTTTTHHPAAHTTH
jgi:hypothetical protein